MIGSNWLFFFFFSYHLAHNLISGRQPHCCCCRCRHRRCCRPDRDHLNSISPTSSPPTPIQKNNNHNNNEKCMLTYADGKEVNNNKKQHRDTWKWSGEMKEVGSGGGMSGGGGWNLAHLLAWQDSHESCVTTWWRLLTCFTSSSNRQACRKLCMYRCFICNFLNLMFQIPSLK